jgi:hypothetical protein
MKPSLGLYGDLDEVELVHDVEGAFGVRFPDEALADCYTVGDLFGLVVARLPEGGPGAERCASAMAFYRLRRAVRTLAPGIELRPSTPIEGLPGVPVRALDSACLAVEGMRVPYSCRPARSGLGLLSAVALPIVILLAGAPAWTAIIALPLSAALWRLSPLRFPPPIRTIGDLAERIAAHSIGSLAANGARLGPEEAWKALRTICADHAATDGGEIGKGTLLLAPGRMAR